MSPASTPRLLVGLALALAACGGAPPATDPSALPTTAPSTTDPEEVVHKASIEVYSKDGTEILVDGKSIGKAPIKKYELEPGKHDVTFVDENTGNRTMPVDLAPGDHQVVQSDPPPGANMDMKPDDGKKDDGKKKKGK